MKAFLEHYMEIGQENDGMVGIVVKQCNFFLSQSLYHALSISPCHSLHFCLYLATSYSILLYFFLLLQYKLRNQQNTMCTYVPEQYT